MLKEVALLGTFLKILWQTVLDTTKSCCHSDWQMGAEKK